MTQKPQHRALNRSQYKFDFDNAPQREHRLYAYAESDAQLQRASSVKLRVLFEEYCGFKWHDADSNLIRLKRLKGFGGDYWWKGGTLRFYQRSPEIPFFGLAASKLCKDVPIMYSSATLNGTETPARYFFNGGELTDEIPPQLALKFEALRTKQWGIIRPPAELLAGA